MNRWIADGHTDFLYGMVQYGYDIASPKHGQITSLEAMQQGGVAIQLFAAWTDMKLKTPPLDQCLSMIDAYHRMLARCDEYTPLTASFDPADGKIGAVLTVEGGEAIDGSLAVLRILHRLGVRAMTLTWNDNNELAGAALAHGNKGLTELGANVIDEMCNLGIAVDVSHLSDRGIDGVLGVATRPVFASHSNARAVFDSPRSLSDEHIRAIASLGGTIGVNFYYQQLCGRRSACIADVVRHIAHIAEVGGVDCCAVGSDFDGMTQYPEDLRTAADFPALADALSKAGFSDAELDKILYQNLFRYLTQFV